MCIYMLRLNQYGYKNETACELFTQPMQIAYMFVFPKTNSILYINVCP